MSASTPEQAIKAAMAIARDVAEGRVHPAALEAAAIAQCRDLFGTVYRPEAGDEDDELWELHRDVSRQFMAAGGHSVEELAEWLALARTRAGLAVVEPEPSWIERMMALGADDEGDDDDA